MKNIRVLHSLDDRMHIMDKEADMLKIRRRDFLHLTAGAAALPAVSRIARAQAYPSRPVRIITSFPAGGVDDMLARLIGESLAERLGQPFIMENQPTAKVTETLINASPDGYTLALVTAGNVIATIV